MLAAAAHKNSFSLQIVMASVIAFFRHVFYRSLGGLPKICWQADRLVCQSALSSIDVFCDKGLLLVLLPIDLISKEIIIIVVVVQNALHSTYVHT